MSIPGSDPPDEDCPGDTLVTRRLLASGSPADDMEGPGKLTAYVEASGRES